LKPIKTTDYSTGKQIFFNFRNLLALTATVDYPNASVNDEGRTIIKAGTPLGGTKLYPAHEDQTLIPSSTPDVVLMHDVDVTDGPETATVVVQGDAVLSNMDSNVREMYTDNIIKALPKINFTE
jgi:hypothetical protein